MKRREFMIATSLAAAGLAIGLSEKVKADNKHLSIVEGKTRYIHPIRYPQGGCTESSIVSFDHGPFGRDPYGFYA